jgi:hypothetical protein
MWPNAHSRLWKTSCYCPEYCGNWTPYTFFISPWILGVRSVLDDICRDNNFMLSNVFSENSAVYEMMWKKCLVAFPLQKWLRERTTLLCFTYLALVFIFAFYFYEANYGHEVKFWPFSCMSYFSWFIQQKFDISLPAFCFHLGSLS